MRRIIVGLLVLCGVAVAAPAHAVYNGREVPDERDAFMAAIRVGGKKAWCGGTVIAPRYVLTAAHCVFGGDPTQLTVRVGSRDARKATQIGVEHGFVHPKFDYAQALNDAAILRLDRPVPRGVTFMTLATAASDNLERPHTSVVAAGWGRPFYSGPDSVTLREANLQVVPETECGDAPGSNFEKNDVCAKGTMQSVCNGDSGGPLFFRSPTRVIQIGITSSVFICGMVPGQTNAFFTEVNNPIVRSWITSVAGV